MRKLNLIGLALFVISAVVYGQSGTDKSEVSWESGAEKFFVDPTTVRTGIGTTKPICALDVVGRIRSRHPKRRFPFTKHHDRATFVVQGFDGSTWKTSMLLKPAYQYFSGNLGIGVMMPEEKLDVAGVVKMNGFKLPTGAVDSYVLTSDSNGTGSWQSIPLQWSQNGDDIYFNTGQVCIGVTTPQSALTVNGTITAKEIEVQVDILPDFVFEDNYKLMSLNKLEKHIKKEKSLPGIPTSREAVEEGLKLGEMQAKLLEKVEELTLYVIEQNKEIAELKEKISKLEK